jgi:SAM-dependent methyltransferase
MATIEQNIALWSDKESWKDSGEEWSVAWGGTANLWHGTLMPRIKNYVFCNHILEVAPGYGRITEYLRKRCQRLTIVDLNQSCIDICKKRFEFAENIKYFVNDGKTLSMIENNSVDFVISWDSLVHCDIDVVESYLKESFRVLRAGGAVFFHHSNFGVFNGKKENPHFRSTNVTGKIIKIFGEKTGLKCVCQEIIDWGGISMSDCISLFIKSDSAVQAKIIRNNKFMEEADAIKNKSFNYYS